MLQSFVITLREGLEAFLIIAISLAYLRKSQNSHLVPAVHLGIVVSVVLSVVAGLMFARATNQALWEGILAMASAVMVVSLTVHMRRVGKHMKTTIERRLSRATLKTGIGTFIGVFGFTLLMITREGMETALMMNALLFQVRSVSLIIGAVAGTACAATVALLWARYGHRVNLGQFFQVTAIFLFVFAIQLFIYGFHELTEANILPYSEILHWATEPYGPDGRLGRYFSFLLVIVPLGWLILSWRSSPNRESQAIT